METVKELITYFIIYSFLGWIIESIYKSFCEKKIVNSGFLYGPICPIYGFGAIIMYLFLDDVSNKPIMTFIIGFTVLTFWEYMVGIILEKIFHTKYWDYSQNKFNFQGRICLVNSIFWGVLSVLFIDIIHPTITKMLGNLNSNLVLNITVIALIVLIIDTILSIATNFSMFDKLKRIDELNNAIREKLDEIKSKGMSNTHIQDAIEELKAKQEKIVRRLYRKVIRIKKAFPTMKSEQITKFLNEKTNFFKSK